MWTDCWRVSGLVWDAFNVKDVYFEGQYYRLYNELENAQILILTSLHPSIFLLTWLGFESTTTMNELMIKVSVNSDNKVPAESQAAPGNNKTPRMSLTVP